MKKIILFLYFLFLSTLCYAQSYWVYVRTTDRSGLNLAMDKGRSKDGDVVAILPDIPQYKPTSVEKEEWLILHVSNLNQKEIEDMISPVLVDSGRRDKISGLPKMDIFAFRKNKLNYRAFTRRKNGILEGNLSKQIVLAQMSRKTNSDFAKYELKSKVFAALYPLQKLSDWLVPNARASVVSTINKAGEDYNTLTLWEDAIDGVLTDAQIADCYDDQGVLTETSGFTINGSTTTTTNTITIRSATGERHRGVFTAGTSGTGFRMTGAGTGSLMTIDDDNIIIDGIQFDASSVTTAWANGIKCENYVTNFIFSNNILVGAKDTSLGGSGIQNDQVRGTTLIYNNIIYGFWHNYADGISLLEGDGSTVLRVLNNTVYSNDQGINGDWGAGTEDFSNNFIGDCKDSFGVGNGCIYRVANIGSGSNNICSHSSQCTAGNLTSGTNSATSYSSYFVNVTAGSEDLHVKSTSSVLYNAGTSKSSYLTTDIDGGSRPSGGAWDVGADELAFTTIYGATIYGATIQ